MIEEQGLILQWVVLWAMLCALVAWHSLNRGTRRVSGLVLAFLLNLSAIHWFAATLLSSPAYPMIDIPATEMGLRQSLFGLTGFVGGYFFWIWITARKKVRSQAGPEPKAESPEEPSARDVQRKQAYRTAGYCFAGGLVSVVFLQSVLGGLPTVSALTAVAAQLMVAGICLGCWFAWRERNLRRFLGWLALSSVPVTGYLLLRGFLAMGISMVIIVLAFVAIFLRPRWVLVAGGLVAGYLLVSFYVGYMEHRREIRGAIWGGAPAADRLTKTSKLITEFEFFDPGNTHHLYRVDERLNQNHLVGSAVIRLQATGEYAAGGTLINSALAVIPRAIWPDKPVVAGGGTMVTDHTGIIFAEGTSVGPGQVFEFYVNFGTAGVVVGFFLLGLTLTWVDGAAGARLAGGDLAGFLLYFLPGIALIQPQGTLVELSSSAVAALVLMLGVTRLMKWRRSRRKTSVEVGS